MDSALAVTFAAACVVEVDGVTAVIAAADDPGATGTTATVAAVAAAAAVDGAAVVMPGVSAGLMPATEI